MRLGNEGSTLIRLSAKDETFLNPLHPLLGGFRTYPVRSLRDLYLLCARLLRIFVRFASTYTGAPRHSKFICSALGFCVYSQKIKVMSYEEKFIFEDRTRWQDCGEGMRRQIMGYGKDLMLVKIEFNKGAVGAMHSHPHSQSSMVVSGSFEVTIGGETSTLHAGDGYFVAPGVEHGVLCTEQGTLIDTFAPCREDFL